jgi:DNA-binding transcriptional ArsR family regulator
MTRQTPKRAKLGPGAPQLQDDVLSLRALAHPLRLRLLEAFRGGPQRISDLARAFGVPRTRLYYHVKALVDAGILRASAVPDTGGGAIARYELIPQRTAPTRRAGRHRQTSSAGKDRIRISPALANAVMERTRTELVATLAGSHGSNVMLIHLMLENPMLVAAVQRRLQETVAEAAAIAGLPPARIEGSDAEASANQSWMLTMTLIPLRRERRDPS